MPEPKFMFYLCHFYFQRAGVLTVLDKESLFARYVIVIFHNICYLSSVQIMYSSYWEWKLANIWLIVVQFRFAKWIEQFLIEFLKRKTNFTTCSQTQKVQIIQWTHKNYISINTQLTLSAVKHVWSSCDWFWFYFWMDEKLAQVF